MFPSLNHVWVTCVLAVIIMRALVWPIAPADFWWQIAHGRWIVENGAIPVLDHFSFTRAGEAVFNQPWLAQLLMYGVYAMGGVALSLIVLALLLATTYAIVLRLCIAQGARVRVAALILLVSLLPSMTNWSLRSQTFALPLFVSFLTILSSWRRGQGDDSKPSSLWLLPPLMAVWVNLHGSFVLGGVLIALFIVGEVLDRLRATARQEDAPLAQQRMKALLLWGALTAAAMLLNPRGLDIIEYLLGFLESQAIQHIVTEWAPTSLGTTVGRLFAAYCVVVLVAGVLGRRRLDVVEVLIVITFFALALRSQRHILWFALASVPFSARHISAALTSRATRPPELGSRAANWAILAIIAAAVVAVLPPWKSRLPLAPHLRLLVSADTPIATVRFMQQDTNAPLRLFHSETTGSYLLWAAPERKVFVDSRVHLYPLQQLLDFQELSAGNSVATLLEKYAIDGLLLDNTRQSALLDWANQQADWELRFAESCCTYFVKTTGTEPGQTR